MKPLCSELFMKRHFLSNLLSYRFFQLAPHPNDIHFEAAVITAGGIRHIQVCAKWIHMQNRGAASCCLFGIFAFLSFKVLPHRPMNMICTKALHFLGSAAVCLKIAVKGSGIFSSIRATWAQSLRKTCRKPRIPAHAKHSANQCRR